MSIIRMNDLPEATSITSDDILIVMDDPSGSSVTKKITINNLLGGSTSVVSAKGSLESPNDHQIIQDAINTLPSGGGRIFLQAGNYYLSNTVTINKPNIEIVGAGRATQLNCVGDYGDTFRCELPTIPTVANSGLNGLVFDSIRFESTVPRTSGAAIYAAYTHQASLKNLYICDTTYARTYSSSANAGLPPESGGPGYLYYSQQPVVDASGNYVLDEYDEVIMSGVLSVPLPIPFYNGIQIIGQDQINIDNCVICSSNKGIYIEGSNYGNADFSYDGVISKCHLWGTKYGNGVGIHLDKGVGGFLIDYASLNAWGTGIYADARQTTQGGGIITIRDGFAEGCAIGYKTLKFQNTVINNLWANVDISGVDGNKLTVIGVYAPGATSHNIKISGGIKAFIVGNSGSYTTTGTSANFTKIG